MKRKFIWIFSSVIVLILLLGINNQTGGFGREAMLKPAKYHELKITKIDNEWKVVLSEDLTKKKVKAKRNDRITWYADGTDAYLEFMDDNLFGKYKDKVKDGKYLTIKIKDVAHYLCTVNINVRYYYFSIFNGFSKRHFIKNNKITISIRVIEICFFFTIILRKCWFWHYR